MTSINLSQAAKEVKPKKSLLDQGVLLTFIVFILVLLAYGGLLIYERTLNNNLATLETEISSTLNAADSEEIERVLDFDIRSKEANQHVLKGDYVGFMLTELERTMVSGVFLNSFNQVSENNVITVVLASVDLENISKQILSIKRSDAIGSVEVLSSEFTDEGLWNTEVNIAYLVAKIDETLENK